MSSPETGEIEGTTIYYTDWDYNYSGEFRVMTSGYHNVPNWYSRYDEADLSRKGSNRWHMVSWMPDGIDAECGGNTTSAQSTNMKYRLESPGAGGVNFTNKEPDQNDMDPTDGYDMETSMEIGYSVAAFGLVALSVKPETGSSVTLQDYESLEWSMNIYNQAWPFQQDDSYGVRCDVDVSGANPGTQYDIPCSSQMEYRFYCSGSYGGTWIYHKTPEANYDASFTAVE
jgi:hypothetical protein